MLLKFIYFRFAVDSMDRTGIYFLFSGQRPGLSSLLDSSLNPAQAKDVHSGCLICFIVINKVYEKYQERSNRTKVIKMKMNNDTAKN